MSVENDMIEAAYTCLPDSDSAKRWMTARSLARRMQNRAECPGPSQDKLYDALVDHYDAPPESGLRIRASRLPSRKTLETLWGRVKVGETQAGESPVLREPTSGDFGRYEGLEEQSDNSEDEDVTPNLFLSYSHLDERRAFSIAAQLDALGYCTWVAGERILAGDRINDSVRAALEACSAYAVFVTENSTRSKWVTKELTNAHIAFGIKRCRHFAIISEDSPLKPIIEAWKRKEHVTPPESLCGVDGDLPSMLEEIAALQHAYFIPTEGPVSGLESFPRYEPA